MKRNFDNISQFNVYTLFFIVGGIWLLLSTGCSRRKTVDDLPVYPRMGSTMSPLDSAYYHHCLSCPVDTQNLTAYKVFRYNELLRLKEEACGSLQPIQFMHLVPKNVKDSLYYFLNLNTVGDTIDLHAFLQFQERLVDSLGANHYWIAKCQEAEADQYYLFYGDIYRSYRLYKRALNIYENLDWVSHERIYFLTKFAQRTIAHREYLQGKSYGQQAILLAKTYFPNDPVLNAYASMQTGLLKMGLYETDNQLYFNEAFQWLDNTPYHRLYQNALKYSIFLPIVPESIRKTVLQRLVKEVEQNGDLVNVEKTLGEQALMDEEFEKSIDHFQKALDWFDRKTGVHPALILTVYYELTQGYFYSGQHELARQYAIANTIHSHRFSEDKIPELLNAILKGKYTGYFNFISYIIIAQTYLLEDPNDLLKLKMGLQFIDLAQKQLEEESNSIEENRRIILLNYSKDIFKTGMHITYQLYALTENKEYFRQFTDFGEQLKAVILEGDADQTMQSFNIPEDLVRKDKWLRSRIRLHRPRSGNPDSLQHYLREVDSLNLYYQQYFPEFFLHRVLGQINTEFWIPEHACLISYDQVDSFLYIQVHTSSESSVQRITMDSFFVEILDTLIQLQRDPKASLKDYQFYSSALARQLWPELPRDIDQVGISTSGAIGAFSFSALMIDSIHYAIDRYKLFLTPGLRFADSTFWEPMGFDDQRIASFGFTDSRTIQTSAFSELELSGSYNECEKIIAAFPKTAVYRGYQARKDKFLEVYQDTTIDVLHCAVHGISYSDELDHVYLLFRNGKDQLDTLYGYELLEFQSSVYQVLLTSCFTQSGFDVEGEGRYNLARYFLLNGAQRVVTSKWALDDRTISSQIENLLLSGQVQSLVKAIKAYNEKPNYWGGIVEVRM